MPQTRSVTRSNTLSSTTSERLSKRPSSKRKIAPLNGDDDATPSTKRLKKQSHTDHTVVSAAPLPLDGCSDQPMIDAVLTFSFEDAKAHLISVDPRFAELFGRLKCKPFEHLDQVHPFRSLVQSILGHVFDFLHPNRNVRSPQSFFPTPHQVANTDIITLKSAGLSTRKAEYVKDLATRFADGRLSMTKLLNADDEELVQMLTEVRGIGKWTVDMFAIFTLRRPNILPVGDLGVQRGMLRWFGGTGFKIRSDKVGQQDTSATEQSEHTAAEQTKTINTEVGAAEVPLPSANDDGKMACTSVSRSDPKTNLDLGSDVNEVAGTENSLPPSISIPTAEDPSVNSSAFPPPTSHQSQNTALPPPTSPSPLIQCLAQASTLSSSSLHDRACGQGNSPDGHMKPWTKPLPNGLTPTSMKSRLSGKKVKGALLTPQEMEALATEWAPYRSLGLFQYDRSVRSLITTFPQGLTSCGRLPTRDEIFSAHGVQRPNVRTVPAMHTHPFQLKLCLRIYETTFEITIEMRYRRKVNWHSSFP
ncbi:DNA glycosylase [Pisolithus albus]|nr:DNA glycosylase [Pisolithus albus]